MKRLLWILVSVVLLVAATLVGVRTEIAGLWRFRERQVVQADKAGADLDGVQVRVNDVWAMSASNFPDRAAIVVRLALSGPQSARDAWSGCDVSLQDDAGRVWLPVSNADTDTVIRFISPDGDSKGRCNPMPYDAPPEGQAILSDQLFLVPAALLKGARLRVSAPGTRPRALEFAVNPVLRDLH